MGVGTLHGFYNGVFDENHPKVEGYGKENSGVSKKFSVFSEWLKNTSFEESLFLAYGKTYRELLFRATFQEMKMASASFLKKEQMKVLQNYETLANILAMAFGSGKKEPDRVHNITSVEQLQHALGSALNGGK
jgi:hypothetical protein